MEKISLRSSPVVILAGLSFAALVVAASAWLVWEGVRDLRVAIESREWPSTRGVVVQSKVSRERGGWLGRKSRVDIEYRYMVGDRAYAAARVAFGAGASQTSRQVVYKYPAGSEVTIHYMKHAPGIAVLEPGGSVWTLGLVFYTFLLLGLLGLGAFAWALPKIAWRD